MISKRFNIILSLGLLLSLYSPSYAQNIPSTIFNSGIRLEQDIKQQEREKRFKKELAPITIESEDKKPKDLSSNKYCLPVSKIELVHHGFHRQKLPSSYLIKKEYENKCLSKKQITKLLTQINTLYSENDFFQAQSYIQPQSFKDGILKVDMHPAKLGKITINGKDSKFQPLKFFYAKTKENDVIKFSDLESTIDAINANPAINARLNVSPSKEKHKTDINIEVKEKDKFRGRTGLNNQGQSFSGLYRVSPSIELHNILKIGDSWNLNYIGNGDSDALIAAFSLPLLPTWTVRGNYVYSDFLVQFLANGTPTAPLVDYYGTFQSYDLSINKEVFRKKDLIINASAGGKSKKSTRELNSVSLEPQQQYIANASVNAVKKYKSGQITGGVAIDWGLPILGATQKAINGRNDIPDGKFFKVSANANLQHITPWFVLSSSANGQFSPDATFGTEHLILGGMYSVRGYTEGIVSSEIGLLNRNEAILKHNFKNKYLNYINNAIQPSVFFDQGIVSTPYQKANRTNYLSSIGAGINVNWKILNLGLYYGYPLLSSNNIRSPKDGRFHFNISLKLW